MKLTIILLIILLFPAPVNAIDGYVELSYNFLGYNQATIELWRDIDQVRIGIKGVSKIEYTLKEFIPSAAPLNQYYEGYIQYNLNDWTIKLSSYCTHWFSQSGRHWFDDTVGLDISVRYNF